MEGICLKELFQSKFSKKQFLFTTPQLPLLGEGGGRGQSKKTAKKKCLPSSLCGL